MGAKPVAAPTGLKIRKGPREDEPQRRKTPPSNGVKMVRDSKQNSRQREKQKKTTVKKSRRKRISRRENLERDRDERELLSSLSDAREARTSSATRLERRGG